jgi:acetolactate synthase-1/2/3 large subunit
MELNAAMEAAFSEENKNRLVFVDVWVDPHEHVYPMAIKGGAMNDMILSKTQEASS